MRTLVRCSEIRQGLASIVGIPNARGVTKKYLYVLHVPVVKNFLEYLSNTGVVLDVDVADT